MWRRASVAKRRGPLVVCSTGTAWRGTTSSVGDVFPNGVTVAALRGPIASEGIVVRAQAVGRPLAASLADGMAYVEAWLGAQERSSVWLVGFPAARYGGPVARAAPQRYAGVGDAARRVAVRRRIALDGAARRYNVSIVTVRRTT